jgi:pyridoxal phosphate enzyme (YggS family)
MQINELSDRIAQVQERIAAAALRVGRDPSSVRWVAVTKEQPLAAAEAAVKLGLLELGENRIEALAARRVALPEPKVRWHMIGRLQRRTAPGVHGLAHLVHSVDSERLAERLHSTLPEGAEPLAVLLQVNTSGEPQKGGVEPDEAVDVVGRIASLGGLRVEGLMTMAPFVDDEGVLRRAFSSLRAVQARLGAELPDTVGGILSMGMSNDFELAVEEGSTMVRLGTILFGERGP